MPYFEIVNEDPELRKQLADFVIFFSTIENYISDFAYRSELFEGKRPNFRSIAKKDLSEKREIIKSFINGKLPILMDLWNIINSRIGSLNNERKFLIHSVGLFNINSSYFNTGVKQNGRFKIYSSSDIKKLNEQIDDLIFGDEGLASNFYSKFVDELESLKKAKT